MGDLFQVIIYVIVGLIWLISVAVSKSRKRSIPGEKEVKGPTKAGEKELKDFLRNIGLDLETAPEPEVVLQEPEETEEEELFHTEKPPEPVGTVPMIQTPAQPVALKPQVNSLPSSEVVFHTLVSHLSQDVLKEGIILSTILGPPRSVQLLKGLTQGNLRWRNIS